jgi:hypothetical protein
MSVMERLSRPGMLDLEGEFGRRSMLQTGRRLNPRVPSCLIEREPGRRLPGRYSVKLWANSSAIENVGWAVNTTPNRLRASTV